MGKFQKKQTVCEAEQFFYAKPKMKGVFYPPEENGTYFGDAFVLRSGDEERMYLQNTDWVIYGPDGEVAFAVKDGQFREIWEEIAEPAPAAGLTITLPYRQFVALINECDRLESENGMLLLMTLKGGSQLDLAGEVQRLKAEIRHQKNMVEVQETLRLRGDDLHEQELTATKAQLDAVPWDDLRAILWTYTPYSNGTDDASVNAMAKWLAVQP